MIELTIFTPTYNRAYILPQLFNSLLAQTNKNFEWLIVDDGSSDNTKEIIETFKNQASFKITHIYQENQGKHVAINNALTQINTTYFVTVDSDDFLVHEGITILLDKLFLIKDQKKIIAIASPITILNTNQKKKITKDTVATSCEMRYKYNMDFEATLVFKTEIAKKYEYPIFKDEKFMLESVVFNRMDKDYKFLYITESVVNAEYIPDGLTASGKKKFIDSPKGAALAYEEKMNNKNIPLESRKSFAKNFWDYESLTKKSFISKIKKVRSFTLKFYLIKYFTKRILFGES